jgi:magnesium-transporting ATPase (P-type)
MVLADDNFTSIVAAVKEGRRVWDNIVRLLLFNLPVRAMGICCSAVMNQEGGIVR